MPRPDILNRWENVLDLPPCDPRSPEFSYDVNDADDLRDLADALGACDTETSPEIRRQYESLALQTVTVCALAAPIKAAEDNIPAGAGFLPALRPVDCHLRLVQLEELEAKIADFLEDIDSRAVSFTDRISIAHMIHKLEAARYTLTHPYQVSSPHKYIEPIGQLVCFLLREGYGTPIELQTYFRRFFTALPDYLHLASELIRERVEAGEMVFATSLEAAKETIPQLLILLDGDVTSKFSGMPDCEEYGFPNHIAAAKESLQAFLTFLESLTGHPTEGFAVGEDDLRDIYKYERGLGDVDPIKLAELGKSEVATWKEQVLDLRRELAGRYGIEITDGMTQAQFMEQLRPHMHFAEDKEGLFALCRKAFDTANDFFTSEAGRRFVPALPCDIKVKNAPEFLQQYGFMVLFANLFDPEDELPAAEYWLGADHLKVQTNPMCSLEHLVEVGTHEVTPGHINQGRFLKTNPDVAIRTGSSDNIGLIEGWGLFAEEIAYESGFFDYAADKLGLDRDIVKMFYLQGKLLRAGRMVVDPGLQTGTMTQEDVARFLTDECLQNPDFAKGQASYYPMLPGYPSTYYPGHMFLKALRDTSVEILSSGMPPDEARLWFYQVYLAECGTMAAPLVSRYVVGRALQERSRPEREDPGVASPAASAMPEPVGAAS